MSKDEALEMADSLRSGGDAVVFSEDIFEPEFVPSAEARELIEQLEQMRDGEDDALGDLCRRASEMITLLSAKKVVRGTVEGGILDISECPPGVEVVVHDYDIQEVDEDRLTEDEDGRECVTLEYGG
jgi:hypothetical protein